MPSSDYAQLVVKFDLKKGKRFDTKEEFANYIQSQLDENVSSGRCKIKMLGYTTSNSAKVTIRILGDDLEKLVKVSDDLQKKMHNIQGITGIRDNWNDNTLQLNVQIDNNKASSFGISKYDIQKEINLALYGYNASVFRKDGSEYNVRVKSNIDNTSMLENFRIKSSITSNKIPLNELAQIGYSKKMNTINTYKNEPEIEIYADPLPGYSSSKIEDQIEKELIPSLETSGVQVKFAGEREDVAENFTALGLLALVAIFAIYVILMIQFESFIQPLIILLTIPLSLIGSILGLFVFRQPLSLTAFLGVIALSGLVVKNGILLIDYINDARNRGCSIEHSCKDAVEKRFNAIMLSALTVILALIPLAVSGSDLFAPMAVSLMSGLLVSTFLTMVVIPVIYSIVEERSWKRIQWKIILNKMKNALVRVKHFAKK